MPRQSESLISKMLKFADEASIVELDAAIEILQFAKKKLKGDIPSTPRKTRKKRGANVLPPDGNPG